MEAGHQSYQAGDIVYVIYRNPHTYNVANVQEAAVVHHPEQPGELAMFLYETYFPLDENIAVYSSLAEAEMAYEESFGSIHEGGLEW
ncbi:transcriptional regulator SplA domain-containing protein [Halobacillus andaensis]|uniref:transcriptional regulator SplA domain-containing protein n=1 Tax=Halobacillus andaensis TaxID=1176239 RepID=UPI003D70F26B